MTDTGGIITNASGAIAVTSGALKLSGVQIDGGTISSSGSGTIEVNGPVTIDDGASVSGAITVDVNQTLTLNDATFSSGIITNDGKIAVATSTLNLAGGQIDGGTITNIGGTIEVSGPVTIDDGATLNGAITVDSGATLTLNGVTDTGGIITNKGVIDVTGTATLAGGSIDGGTISNTGGINVTASIEIDGHASLDGSITVQSNSTLTLDDVTYSGTLTNSTNAVVQVDTTATLTLNTVTITGSGTLTNNGTIDATAGTTKIEVSTDNEGTIVAEDRATSNLGGQVTGGGSVVIETGGIVDISAVNIQTVNFVGGNATLKIDALASYTGTVKNFGAGDTIELTGITYSSGDQVVWTQGTGSHASGGSNPSGTLAIEDGATTLASIQLVGSYVSSEFASMSDISLPMPASPAPTWF